jgi:hypothetical protein
MADDKEVKTIKSYFLQNLPFIFGVVLALINLYMVSIISPIKQDINVLAERVDKLETTGSITAQVTAVKVANIEKTLDEVKTIVKDINEKIDRHIER